MVINSRSRSACAYHKHYETYEKRQKVRISVSACAYTAAAARRLNRPFAALKNYLYPVYKIIEYIYDTINYNYDNQLLNILTYKSIRPVYGENARMPGVFLRLKRSRALTSSLDQCGATL